MRRATREDRLLPAASKLRLVLQCRDAAAVRDCEDIAFAFARDSGLGGVDVWYVAACAAALAEHAVDSGGGALELSVVELPRPSLIVRVRHGRSVAAATPAPLHAARGYVDDLEIEWYAGTGTLITARKWLRGRA